MIDFQGARVLSYKHNNNYFGDNFRYGTTKSLSVEGSIYQLRNEEGVQPVWSGISGIVNGAVDYDDIILNGTNFGRGRIESLNFSEGNDVTKKNYTANITIFSTGNLFNMTGLYYSGLDLNNTGHPIYLTESFSEDFSFDLDENQEWNFEHSLQIKFVSGKANGNSSTPLGMAKLLAKNLFENSIPAAILDPNYEGGIYNTSGKAYFTESLDEITSECSFSKRIKFGQGSGVYSISYNHGVNTDENGVTTVSEEGKIKGVVEPLLESAKNGYSSESSAFYGRCSQVFDAYKPGNANPLSDTRIRLRKTINEFLGEIDYGVSYTNDPRIHLGYSWEYTQEISRSENCVVTVAERGQVKGISDECRSNDVYQKALTGWSSVKSGIASRSAAYYHLATSLNNALKNIGRSESRSQFNGTVEYDYTYNDDPNSNIDGFRRIDYSVEDATPVHLVARFVIPGYKEIVQPQQNATLGSRTVTMEINGYRTTTLAQYRDYAKVRLNQLIPIGTDVFINDVQYSLNETEKIFNIQCSWSYVGYRAFENTNV